MPGRERQRRKRNASWRTDTQNGWLALLGGGEFSFGETEEADQAWIERTPPGPVGFIPAASGSNDYPRHFAEYLKEEFDREMEIIPIYRERDGRRGRNSERIRDVAAVYIGGGVADHLLEAIRDTPAAEALAAEARRGGGGGGDRRRRPVRGEIRPQHLQGGPDPRLRLAAGRGGGAELRSRPRPPAAQDAGGRGGAVRARHPGRLGGVAGAGGAVETVGRCSGSRGRKGTSRDLGSRPSARRSTR